MFYRRNWIAVIVLILGVAMFIPVAQAQRQEIEGISCFANTHSAVQASPGEIYIGSFDGKGIFRSTHENKVADNSTLHQVGVLKGAEGKWSWHGYYKTMRPDGDFAIYEFYGDSESGSTAKAIYGTGKLKGIKGEYKTKAITTGKPIVQGTAQECYKVVGWIELPK
jgi:hypothetical protein